MICVIGAGHLGSALIKQLAISGAEVGVIDRNAHKVAVFSAFSNVQRVSEPQAGDAVVLCVKPGDIVSTATWAADYKPSVLISVAAGVTTKSIEQGASGVPVVRTMPNVASAIGFGATGICKGANASDADVQIACDVFEKLGEVFVVDESEIDSLTGISGSGPAYFFAFVEALIDAGVDVGLQREVAKKLAIATIGGAARLMEQPDADPTALRETVTTPNGATAEALKVMRDANLDDIVNRAVHAVKKRCGELSK